jgi:F-type H+-transporting ATPase subunit epsilon
MAAQSMKLDILTPLGPKREGIDVPGVEVPGIAGELGVLPLHESFITAIVPGVVRFREGAKSERIAVGSGFLEVKDTGRVVLLCDRALSPDEIDVAKAREALAQVKAELDAYRGPIHAAQYRDLNEQRMWLEAQVRAVSA